MEDTYFLVEWELNDGYAHSCGVIHSSRLVRRPKEIHTGKLITVTHNEDIRRAKIIKISDDRESLEQDVFNLGVAMQQPLSIDNGTSTPSLDTTIKKLRNMLEKQKCTENVSRNTRASAQSESELYIEQNIDISPRNSTTQEPNELAQLHEELAKAQLQFMEINHFVDSLKDKVDLIGMRIKSWENDSLISSTSDNTFETPREMGKRNNEPDEEFTPKPKRTKVRKRMLSAESDDETKNKNNDDEEMVGIGSGSTKIPKHVMNQMDWRSHSIATRKLLMAIFPRKVLATHSLTGKSSPAFTNKPAKLRLNPTIIRDIIMTVSHKCSVNPSMVRGAITTKCADENKMFRTREEKKRANKSKKSNQENIEPKEAVIKYVKTNND